LPLFPNYNWILTKPRESGTEVRVASAR